MPQTVSYLPAHFRNISPPPGPPSKTSHGKRILGKVQNWLGLRINGWFHLQFTQTAPAQTSAWLQHAANNCAKTNKATYKQVNDWFTSGSEALRLSSIGRRAVFCGWTNWHVTKREKSRLGEKACVVWFVFWIQGDTMSCCLEQKPKEAYHGAISALIHCLLAFWAGQTRDWNMCRNFCLIVAMNWMERMTDICVLYYTQRSSWRTTNLLQFLFVFFSFFFQPAFKKLESEIKM